MMDVQDDAQFFAAIQALVEVWCDRRCLGALRCILAGYPMGSTLTDGWIDLYEALRNVHVFARDELTEQEIDIVGDLMRVAYKVAYR